MSPTPITVTFYNMHKGMPTFNHKVRLNSMADAPYDLRSDVFFSQEVQGRHQARSNKTDGFPEQLHHGFLGEWLSYNHSYDKNAVYPQRYHGNTILSHLPIETLHNLNITVDRSEQRGVPHYEVLSEGWETLLVCLCAHLNLRGPSHVKQYRAIFEHVSIHIDPTSPLIIAGNFNDWYGRSALPLGEALNLDGVLAGGNGRRPRTFPSRMPFLSLDHVYTRDLEVFDAQTHNNKHWQHLSDHLPLSAKIRPKLRLPRQTV